jgi:two-component system CheB/CheR fusion protein
MDREGTVSWNAGAAKVLGYTEQEILGHYSGAIFTVEDRAAGAPERERRFAREAPPRF